MNKVIYEANMSFQINPYFISIIIFSIALLFLLLIFWKKIDIGLRCFLLFILSFFVFLIACSIYDFFDSKQKIYDQYCAGKYLTVEGTISNYELAEENQPYLSDCFEVDEIEFCVPGFVSRWGYPLKQEDGGLLQNGMNVRICYVFYKCENVIMKIETVDN